jgi:hypothetical protein
MPAHKQDAKHDDNKDNNRDREKDRRGQQPRKGMEARGDRHETNVPRTMHQDDTPMVMTHPRW